MNYLELFVVLLGLLSPILAKDAKGYEGYEAPIQPEIHNQPPSVMMGGQMFPNGYLSRQQQVPQQFMQEPQREYGELSRGYMNQMPNQMQYQQQEGMNSMENSMMAPEQHRSDLMNRNFGSGYIPMRGQQQQHAFPTGYGQQQVNQHGLPSPVASDSFQTANDQHMMPQADLQEEMTGRMMSGQPSHSNPQQPEVSGFF